MKELINLLENKTNVDEYFIKETKTSSTELFFIKEKLQMNRGKDVEKTSVTIFRNFENSGKKYKGSSTTILSPSMTIDEIGQAIDTASLAASFVKNEYYELEVPSGEIAPIIPSSFSEGRVIEDISNLVTDLYEEDNQFNAFINSSEFFINKHQTRIINSNGIDQTYTSYKGEVELITEANGETESIELFDILRFSDYDKEDLQTAVKEALYYAKLRAKAIPMPQVENIPVIFNGIAAKRLYSFYEYQYGGGSIYNKFHDNKVGDNIQGEGVIGDKVNIKLTPIIPNSTVNTFYDSFGTYLKETTFMENGIIKNILTSKRNAYYLNLPTTGLIPNTVVSGGQYTEEELKQGPYLELLKFSSFQIQSMTGNFGGEFRLGIYFDGEKEIPVTLGSVSANMYEAQKEMYLSKETVTTTGYSIPKIVKFTNVRIAGN